MITFRGYFDYNATTPAAPEVIRAMQSALSDHFANPSSMYAPGRYAASLVRNARRQVAEYLNIPDERGIIFTSGGTESNNLALRSALVSRPERREVVISAVEHSSVRSLAHQLAKEGFTVHEIGVDESGALDLESLKQKLNHQTAVVSIMMANNETGVVFPIKEIAALVREKGILMHVDAVQAAGKMEIPVRDLGADFLSLSGHKIYGPKGIGVLYAASLRDFHPLIFGGSQERGRRPGTENVAGILGLEAAVGELVRHPEERERIEKLRDFFEAELMRRMDGVSVTAQGSPRLPNTSHVRVAGADSEAVLMALDQRGICASRGSACLSGAQEPSYVLRAMGFSESEAASGIRFSFGRYTEKGDVENLLNLFKEAVKQVRSASPDLLPSS